MGVLVANPYGINFGTIGVGQSIAITSEVYPDCRDDACEVVVDKGISAPDNLPDH